MILPQAHKNDLWENKLILWETFRGRLGKANDSEEAKRSLFWSECYREIGSSSKASDKWHWSAEILSCPIKDICLLSLLHKSIGSRVGIDGINSTDDIGFEAKVKEKETKLQW